MDHGPLFISFGWERKPLLDPKKGHEMMGPTWNCVPEWDGPVVEGVGVMASEVGSRGVSGAERDDIPWTAGNGKVPLWRVGFGVGAPEGATLWGDAPE